MQYSAITYDVDGVVEKFIDWAKGEKLSFWR